MLKFKIHRGLRFVASDGRVWTVDRLNVSKRVQLIDADGVIESLTVDQVFQRWLTFEWNIDPQSVRSGQDTVYHVIERDLSSYTDAQQQQAVNRLDIIKPLLTDHCLSNSYIREYCISHPNPGNDKVPSPATIRRWIRRYRLGQDLTKLIDRQPCRRPDYDPQLMDLFEQALDNAFLSRERPSKSDAINELGRLVKEHNKTVPPDDKVKLPSRATLYRRLEDIDGVLADCARFGSIEAKRMHRTALQKAMAKCVLDRVELDHTLLDIILIDPRTGVVMGRPWLTIAIDVYSKMIYGYYLSFDSPSSNSVMQCLLRGVLPKGELLKAYPDIVNPWPVFGFPTTMVFDNGLDAHANRVLLALQDMCVPFVQYCPRKVPWYKGNVERIFRTLNSLIHNLPGTTFSNVKERSTYPSEERASLNIDQLEHLLLKWIVDVYHVRTHRTTNMPPIERWKQNVTQRDLYLPASAADLELLLGIQDERTLHHYGIEHEHLKYNSPHLQDLYRSWCKYTDAKPIYPKVTYKYYDASVAYIDVFDPDSKTYLRVPAVDLEYANNLTRHVHGMLIKGLQKEFGHNWCHEDQLRALREIREIVDDAKRSKRQIKQLAKANDAPAPSKGQPATPKPPKQSYKNPLTTEQMADASEDNLPEFGTMMLPSSVSSSNAQQGVNP